MIARQIHVVNLPLEDSVPTGILAEVSRRNIEDHVESLRAHESTIFIFSIYDSVAAHGFLIVGFSVPLNAVLA